MGKMLTPRPGGQPTSFGKEREVAAPLPVSHPNGLSSPGGSQSTTESPSSTAIPSIADTPSPGHATRRLVPVDDMRATTDEDKSPTPVTPHQSASVLSEPESVTSDETLSQPRLSARQRARLEGRDPKGDLYSQKAQLARDAETESGIPRVTKIYGADIRVRRGTEETIYEEVVGNGGKSFTPILATTFIPSARTSEAPTPLTSGSETPPLPTSVEELVDSCALNIPINDNLSLVPGAHAEFVDHEERRKIDAEFGVEMTSRSGELIARAGFDVTEDNKVLIGHSPQGCHRDEISRDARRELVISGFRVRMVESIVHLAEQLGALEVVGYSADRNPKSTLPYPQAIKAMDEVFEAAGFVKDPGDLMYHFPLNQPNTTRHPHVNTWHD